MRKEKQVIVVLGGGINPDGTLRNPSMERVKLAAFLYQKGIAPNIIVSAKYSYQITFVPKGEMTIAEAMKIKLIESGIPEDCIIKEDKSGDTIFNIYNTKQILKKNNWHAIQIVTSSFQLDRARFLCKKILGPDYEVDYSIAGDGLSNDDLSIQNKNEKILLTKTIQAFDQIQDGDDASIIKLLRENKHPDVTEHNPTSLWHSLTPAPFHRPGLQKNNPSDLKEKVGKQIIFKSYKYDVIVVLGGGIDLEGNLRGPSQYRIDKAVELYKLGLAPQIIASSRYSMHLKNKPKKTISEAMRDALVAKGIPPKYIEIEDTSFDTLGNAYYTKINHLTSKNRKNIAIVTSHFHRERAEYLFRKILGDEYNIVFFEAGDGLFEKDLELQQHLEKQQLKAHKEDLEQYKDGDHVAINPENWHPAYSKNPKYTEGEYFKRTRSQLSPFHEEFEQRGFIKSNL